MAHTPGRSPFGDKQSSRLVFEEFVPPSAWTEDLTCHYLLVDLPGFKKQELKLQVDSRTHILVSGERQVRENIYKRFEQSFELPKDADIEKITGKLDAEILYISVPKKVEQEHKGIKQGIIPAPTPTPTLTPAPTPAPAPAPISDEDDSDKISDEDEDDNDNDKKSDAYESNDEPEPAPAAAPAPDGDGKKSNAYETEESNNNKDGEYYLERKRHRTGFDDNWGQDADFLLKLAMEKLKKNKKIVVTAIFAFTLGVLVSQKFQSSGN